MPKFTKLLLLLFSFVFISENVNALTASFTASPSSGCAPLVVTFTNTSSGATSYKWDFGTGTISYLTSPTTSFGSPGTYTVKLTAYSGGDSATYTMTITVYGPPVVAFTASDTAGCPCLSVTFTDGSDPVTPGAATYSWNFGDGGSSTDKNPSHNFCIPGYYNITEAVTNSQGCVSSYTHTGYVHVYAPPIANFSSPNPDQCNPPSTVTFSNSTSGTPDLHYSWTFGDGGTSTDENPSHTYTTTGSYDVTLIVTDGHGCKDTLKRTAYVNIGNLTGSMSLPSTGCVYAPITMSNTTSASYSLTYWFFGDGGEVSTTTSSTTHAYSSPGTYTVKMVVYNGTCYDTVTGSITIYPGPSGDFTDTPAVPCPAPSSVTYTGTAPSGTTYAWVFGDGGSGTGNPITHTHSADGVDTVKMILTSPLGCKDTITHIDTFYNLIPGIYGNLGGGCIPYTVNVGEYNGTTEPDPSIFHEYPVPATYFSWTFGDGGTSAGATDSTPSHTYTAAGVYMITCTVTFANGCSVTVTDSTQCGTPPTADFTADPTHICADRKVYFTNLSTGGATFYSWDFGDSSGTVSDVNPVHTYSLPGTFNVRLVAYNHGCPDTMIKTLYITVDSPEAVIGLLFSCSPHTEIYLGDSSKGDTYFLWNFGDGTYDSTDRNPTHNYPAIGTYTLTLTTYNPASGCRDTATVPVELVAPVPTFYASDTAVCQWDTILCHASVSLPGTVDYAWYVDGYFKVHGSNDTLFKDTLTVPGWYSVMLVIKDFHKCLDTAIRDSYIIAAKPVADFGVPSPIGCAPYTVVFTDSSTDVTGAYATHYQWWFGDGDSASTASVSDTHTYSASGTYSVKEIVTDNIGCKDTLSETSYIHVYKPHGAFYSSIVTPCTGDTVHFYNYSTDMASVLWMFGDGDTSTVITPNHIYHDTGMFTVTLIVFDANGCTDTLSAVNYIKVTAPDVGFIMSDSFSICPPLTVDFTNTTIDGVSYQWYFGDGNSSIITNPSDLYTAAGHYKVTLIATNSHGCVDSTSQYVTVFGYAGAFTYTPLTGCSPLTVEFTDSVMNVPSVTWDFSDGSVGTSTGVDSISHTYTLPGKYVPKLILSDSTGCASSNLGVDTITVDATIPGFTTIPYPVCENDTVQFKDTSRGYYAPVDKWLWTFDDGSTSTISNPTHFYGPAGTYTVALTATDTNGCSASVTESLYVNPPPTIKAESDTTICVGDAAQLTGLGGVSYTWTPPATLSCTDCPNPMASPTVVTVYTVTGKDANGCENTDTVTVKLKTHVTAFATGDTAICKNVPVILTDSGAQTYKWYPTTGLNPTTGDSVTATPGATVTYTVVAYEGSCIPDSDLITVTIYPLPSVDAGPDQTVIAGQTAQLNAKGSDNVKRYIWRDAGTLSCDSCENPVASMTNTTTYTVAVTTAYGCKDSDDVTIHVICDQSQLFIPNSFTPNGDGMNDVFYPRGTGVSVINSFRIYNRWGQLLFERDNIDINDANNAWDGSYQGGAPRPDVYVYILDATCETGEPMQIKGDVTIIR